MQKHVAQIRVHKRRSIIVGKWSDKEWIITAGE